jgi:hypothetical protein
MTLDTFVFTLFCCCLLYLFITRNHNKQHHKHYIIYCKSNDYTYNSSKYVSNNGTLIEFSSLTSNRDLIKSLEDVDFDNGYDIFIRGPTDQNICLRPEFLKKYYYTRSPIYNYRKTHQLVITQLDTQDEIAKIYGQALFVRYKRDWDLMYSDSPPETIYGFISNINPRIHLLIYKRGTKYYSLYHLISYMNILLIKNYDCDIQCEIKKTRQNYFHYLYTTTRCVYIADFLILSQLYADKIQLKTKYDTNLNDMLDGLLVFNVKSKVNLKRCKIKKYLKSNPRTLLMIVIVFDDLLDHIRIFIPFKKKSLSYYYSLEGLYNESVNASILSESEMIEYLHGVNHAKLNTDQFYKCTGAPMEQEFFKRYHGKTSDKKINNEIKFCYSRRDATEILTLDEIHLRISNFCALLVDSIDKTK